MGLASPRVPRPAVRESSALRRLMILACFSPDRPVLTSQEIGESMGLLAVTIELLMARLVRFGCICEDASGIYRLVEHAPYPELRDQR
jgi:hypothetical protein